jgi:hypothetical protein
VKIEGSPARNPYFWVKKTQFEHTYRKHDRFWFALANASESEVRMFGTSKVRVDYLDYRLNVNEAAGAP